MVVATLVILSPLTRPALAATESLVTPPKTLELVGIPLRVKPRMMKTSRDKMKLFIGPAKLVIIRAGKLAD